MGPTFLDNVQCNGSELLLANCSHSEINLISLECSTSREDFGVICKGNYSGLPFVTSWLIAAMYFSWFDQNILIQLIQSECAMTLM